MIRSWTLGLRRISTSQVWRFCSMRSMESLHPCLSLLELKRHSSTSFDGILCLCPFSLEVSLCHWPGNLSRIGRKRLDTILLSYEVSGALPCKNQRFWEYVACAAGMAALADAVALSWSMVSVFGFFVAFRFAFALSESTH